MIGNLAKTCFASCLVLLLTGPAGAQNFPEKFVKVVIPTPNGGLMDQLARPIATELSARWHQPVIVEARLGANGLIAAENVAQSPADGYTILQLDNNSITTIMLLHKPKADFDFNTRLVPVRIIAKPSKFVIANSNFAPNNLKELFELARTKPGAINYGSFGAGSTFHIEMEGLAKAGGVSMSHIPYKGGVPLLQSLMGGEISLTIMGLGTASGGLTDKRLKALAVVDDERWPQLPDVSTPREQGVAFDPMPAWIGWWVPARTPPEVVAKIANDLDSILSDRAFTSKSLPYFLPDNRPGSEIPPRIKAEAADFAARLKDLNISMDF